MSIPKVIIPWVGPWDKAYELDDGGPLATAAAKDMMSAMDAAGAMGVSAGGNHPDWLNPIIAAGGYDTIGSFSWNSIFDAASEFYMADADERKATWTALLTAEIAAWSPDIFFVDQENVGWESWMPATVTAALAAAGLTDTDLYYYRGDSGGPELVDDIPLAPSYYYKLPTPYSVSIWTATDTIAELRARLAVPVNSVDGGRPWVSFYIQANLASQGLVGDVRDVINFCRILREAGAVGIHLWFPPYCVQVGGLDGANNARLLEYMQAAAEVWAPSPSLTPK